MGRKRIEFTRPQVLEMVELYGAGYNADEVGERTGFSAPMIRRALNAEVGDLRVFRAKMKTHRTITPGSGAQIRRELGGQVTSKDYREGFHAGVAQAITLIELHGSEAVRRHCQEILLPWRDTGLGAPPPM